MCHLLRGIFPVMSDIEMPMENTFRPFDLSLNLSGLYVCLFSRKREAHRQNEEVKIITPIAHLRTGGKCLIHNKVCKWTGYFQEAYSKVNCNWVINYKQPVNGPLWYIRWGNQFSSFTAIVTCDNFVPPRIKVSLFDISLIFGVKLILNVVFFAVAF